MNSKVTKDIHKAVNSLLGLKKSRVSFHLVVHVGGKTKSFGTKAACEKFEEYRDVFERALLLDVVSMCNPEPGDDQIVSNVDNIAPKLKSKINNETVDGMKPERLPYPLMVMNRKEKLKSLRYLIVYDRHINFDDSSSKPIFGEASWEPRFWPKDGVKWTSLTKNVGNLKKEDIPGYESPTELYTLLIQNAYHLYGEDPETYIDKSMSKEILSKRRKALGIHDNQRYEEHDEDPADYEGDSDEELNGNAEMDVDGDAELDENAVMDDTFEDNDPYEIAPVVIPPTEAVTPQPVSDSLRNDEPDFEPNPSNPNIESAESRLPKFLEDMIPKMKLKGNCRGGKSLIQCLALKYNLDFDELHKHSTKLLMGKFWIHLLHYFKYPVKMFIENQSGEKGVYVIGHQYELFEFLKTEEYKDAKNTGDAELELLASIIQQPIHLLVFNKRGFPPGTSETDMCEMRTVQPKQILMSKLPKKNKFAQLEDIFLLYDENKRYFQLLVEKNVVPELSLDTSPINPERASSFIEHLHSALNPEEAEVQNQEFDSNNSAGPSNNLAGPSNNLVGSLQYSLFPGETETPVSMTSTLPSQPVLVDQFEHEDLPSGHKRIRLNPSESISLDSVVSVESSSSYLRRSSRIAKRKDNDELFRMLQRPSASTEEREKLEAVKLAAVQKKVGHDNEKHRKIIDAIDKDTELIKRNNVRRKQKVVRLQEMAEELRRGLSAENIKEMTHDNMEYLRNIELGKEDSWRYKTFHEGINDQHLFFSQIGYPFSDDQQEAVFAEVKSLWGTNEQMDRFVDLVIIPEVFIRIYQVFFQLSKKEAEENISNATGNYVRSCSESSEEDFLI